MFKRWLYRIALNSLLRNKRIELTGKQRSQICSLFYKVR